MMSSRDGTVDHPYIFGAHFDNELIFIKPNDPAGLVVSIARGGASANEARLMRYG